MTNQIAGYVPANQIVHTGLATVSKVIGAGAIAKVTGSKVANVKAKHYAEQGAALALAASITGKGRAASVAVYAEAELAKIVNAHGVIDNHRAIVTIARVLDESLTFDESIRADGQRVVKRAVWVALRDSLEKVATNPDTKKARATRHEAALKLYDAIQSRADSIREAFIVKTDNEALAY